MMSRFLDAFRRRRGQTAHVADQPRAGGQAREVEQVVAAIPRPGGRRFLPVDECRQVGALLDVDVLGPGLFLPGESAAPEPGPVRRLAQLTILRQGAMEHRDSLGHRGLLRAPAVRLVSAGAGLISEFGLAREVRRDGGDVEIISVTWAQAGLTTPTVRLAHDIPVRVQGRSRLSLALGPDAAIPSAVGYQATHVSVAAGATVDLALAPGSDVVVAMLSGTGLIGERLREVTSGHLAVLGGDEPRLTIVTHLEDDASTDVLVISTPRLPAEPFIRQGDMIGDSAEDIRAVADKAADGSLGRLPRLDG